jgi:predicted nucleotidyltransferase
MRRCVVEAPRPIRYDNAQMAPPQNKLTGDRALALLQTEASILSQRFGVRKIGIFGSIARGEGRSDSDIDVLVSLSRPTFDTYMDLKFHLEDLLGRTVDLVMESALKPLLREHILREVRYAA